MDCQQTDFFAFGIQIIHSLFDDIADRTHGNNDPVGVFGAIVVEQMVFAAGQLADLAHIVFDNTGNRLIVRVGYFPLLEVNIRVLRGAANHRMIGIQRPATECVERILINQARQIVIIHHFNFLGFM